MKNLSMFFTVCLLALGASHLTAQSVTANDSVKVEANSNESYLGLYKPGSSGIDWGHFITSQANNFTLGAYPNSSSGAGQFNFLEYKYAPDQWNNYYYYLNLNTPTAAYSHINLNTDRIYFGRKQAMGTWGDNNIFVSNQNGASAYPSFEWNYGTCDNGNGCGESMRLSLSGEKFSLDHTNSNISPPLFEYTLWEQLEISAENREIYLNPIRKNVWNGDHANYVGDWGTVVINTYNLVPNTALTVNGPTYIANPNDTSARSNPAFNPNGANKYLLKVESGVLSEDFALATVANWPDYVFSDDYQLLSLAEVQQHIAEKGHLPNVPSAEEVGEEGYSMGDMDAKLLEKIEELTLYLLDQQEQIQELQDQVQHLKASR